MQAQSARLHFAVSLDAPLPALSAQKCMAQAASCRAPTRASVTHRWCLILLAQAPAAAARPARRSVVVCAAQTEEAQPRRAALALLAAAGELQWRGRAAPG